MNVQKLCELIKGEINFNGDVIFHSIKTDSKTIEKDDIFLAIGKGHNYIKEAFDRGAIAAISEKSGMGNIIKVKSSIETLGIIGHYYREKYPIPLIAVTGSVGKTTTKEFISALLGTKYKVLKSEKNHNNHIGLPETLLQLDDTIEVVVVELGMNHLREIAYLSNICKPNYAIITNIGTAHIGNLGSRKNIYKAKMEILEGMDKGYLIVNGKDRYLRKAKFKKGRVIRCKEKKLSVYHVQYYQDRTEFDVLQDKKYHLCLPIPGKAIFRDFLLSLQVGLLFGLSIEDIKEAMTHFETKEGRLQIIEGKFKIIDDTYNSSYEAVLESLKLLRSEKGRKIIILGDMLEFGKFSKKYHKKINRQLRHIHHKKVLLVGKDTKYIKGKHFINLLSLQYYLTSILKVGDTIFLKASRAIRLDKIVDNLKKLNKI